MIGLVPLMILMGLMLGRLVQSLTSNAQDAYADANAFADERIAAVRTVQSFGAEARETTEFDRLVELAMQFEDRKARIQGFSIGAFMLGLGLIYGTAVWVGTVFVANGIISPAGLFGAILNVTNAGLSLGAIGASVPELAKGRAAIVKMYSVIDRVPQRAPFLPSTPPSTTEPGSRTERVAAAAAPGAGEGSASMSGAASVDAVHVAVHPSVPDPSASRATEPSVLVTRPPPEYRSRGAAALLLAQATREGRVLRPGKLDGRIEFDGVWFAYPSRPTEPVLRGLSFVIKPGETVAIVGPSGSGKSTIFALLERFFDRSAGVIKIDAHDIHDLDAAWLHGRIGIVQQEPVLLSGTIRDNIRYGRPDAPDEQVEAAARSANAHDFITAFPDGYATVVGERGAQLSGGQKQRVAIARVVLADPDIFLADEATSALDAGSERVVQEAIDRLVRGESIDHSGGRRRTCIVVAHRLSTVRGADRILVLSGGQVQEQGTHEELLDREGGIYHSLVQHQLTDAHPSAALSTAVVAASEAAARSSDASQPLP